MAEDMQPAVRELTDETFEAEAAQPPGLCVVDFYAAWCPHCRAFRPTFEQVAANYPGALRFCAADVEKCRQAAARFGIRSIPTVVLLSQGEKVDARVGGMSAEALREWLDRHSEG